jgi:hypothetical protein
VNDDEFLTENDKREAVGVANESSEPRAESSKPRASRGPTWVPGHPADLAPSPVTLGNAYRKALEEIHQQRGTAPARYGYAFEVQEKAFWAFYGALADACVTIVCEAYPGCEYAKNHKNDQPRRDVHVVASAPGSGKTTLAKAFAVALTRVTENKPFPLGCVFLVHHIATAEMVYRELLALLPGRVAVFSTKHDAESTQSQPYADLFSVHDLEKHPVIVVTHEFYMGIRGDYARHCTKGDLKFPRVVTFIDERANEIAVYDLDPYGLEGVLRYIQKDNYASRELLDSAVALERFIKDKRYGDQKVETPADDRDGWSVTAAAITYFRSDEAARYVRAASVRKPRLDFDALFGFANALLDERAFISRHNKGKNSANFVGYDRALPRIAGMVLLDATADIDGITAICPWRKRAETPPEHYDRLEIIHVPSVASSSTRRWLWEPGNIKGYADHIRDLILRYVAPGQKGLVVCIKEVVCAENVKDWSEHMVPFLNRTVPEDATVAAKTEFREGFAWSLDGRQVVLTWFGGYGIGANVWRDADVVIVCDDFYLPQRTIKATQQGLRGHKATEGLLAETPEGWTDELKCLMDGHILRWMKQMALRGKARKMDENGICGEQRLVITGDLIRLLAHRPKVFPGAKIRSEQPLDRGQHIDRLVAVLLSSDQLDEISTSVVGDKLGVEWGHISGNLKKHKSYDAVLESIGWSYHRGSGSRAGCFRRIGRTNPLGSDDSDSN